MAPSLRERLEGKRRRTIMHGVQLADPEPLQLSLHMAESALTAASVNGQVSEAELQALHAEVDAARAALEETVVQIRFTALGDDEFEMLVAAHTIPDEAEGARVDAESLLPELAAACADDESVQDPEWWADLLSGDAWSRFEKQNLYYRLFNTLHYRIPSEGLGKD